MGTGCRFKYTMHIDDMFNAKHVFLCSVQYPLKLCMKKDVNLNRHREPTNIAGKSIISYKNRTIYNVSKLFSHRKVSQWVWFKLCGCEFGGQEHRVLPMDALYSNAATPSCGEVKYQTANSCDAELTSWIDTHTTRVMCIQLYCNTVLRYFPIISTWLMYLQNTSP